METYTEMKARHQKEAGALPIGFALSPKYFEEMKRELGVKDDNELYQVKGTCVFYRKTDSALIHGTFERHAKEQEAAMRDITFAQGAFLYEMLNHEYSINLSGKKDVLDACDIPLS